MLNLLEGAGEHVERRRVLGPNVDRVGQPAQVVGHAGDRLAPGRPDPVPQRLRSMPRATATSTLPAGRILFRDLAAAEPSRPVPPPGDRECRAGHEPADRRARRATRQRPRRTRGRPGRSHDRPRQCRTASTCVALSMRIRSNLSMNSSSLSRWWTRRAVARSASPPATAASARRTASRASGHFCSFLQPVHLAKD